MRKIRFFLFFLFSALLSAAPYSLAAEGDPFYLAVLNSRQPEQLAAPYTYKFLNSTDRVVFYLVGDGVKKIPFLEGHIVGGHAVVGSTPFPDCNSHDTMVATTVVTALTDAKFFSVRLSECGSSIMGSAMLAGLKFVAKDVAAKKKLGWLPIVLITSGFTGSGAKTWGATDVAAIRKAGAIVIGAADHDEALPPCTSWPSALPTVVGVGSVDENLTVTSEGGACVDLFTVVGSMELPTGEVVTGSSHAVPLFGAVLAQVWSHWPKLRGDDAIAITLAMATRRDFGSLAYLNPVSETLVVNRKTVKPTQVTLIGRFQLDNGLAASSAIAFFPGLPKAGKCQGKPIGNKSFPVAADGRWTAKLTTNAANLCVRGLRGEVVITEGRSVIGLRAHRESGGRP